MTRPGADVDESSALAHSNIRRTRHARQAQCVGIAVSWNRRERSSPGAPTWRMRPEVLLGMVIIIRGACSLSHCWAYLRHSAMFWKPTGGKSGQARLPSRTGSGAAQRPLALGLRFCAPLSRSVSLQHVHIRSQRCPHYRTDTHQVRRMAPFKPTDTAGAAGQKYAFCTFASGLALRSNWRYGVTQSGVYGCRRTHVRQPCTNRRSAAARIVVSSQLDGGNGSNPFASSREEWTSDNDSNSRANENVRARNASRSESDNKPQSGRAVSSDVFAASRAEFTRNDDTEGVNLGGDEAPWDTGTTQTRTSDARSAAVSSAAASAMGGGEGFSGRSGASRYGSGASSSALTLTGALAAIVRGLSRLLNDFALPIMQIASVMWHDFKLRVLAPPVRPGENPYFIDRAVSASGTTAGLEDPYWDVGQVSDETIPGERADRTAGLSEEERQIEEFQRTSEQVLRSASRTASTLWHGFASSMGLTNEKDRDRR